MYYFLSCAVLRFLFRLAGGITPIGAENIPETGGVILAPNHISYADPPAVGCAIKRQVHYMAKEELFRSRILAKWMYKVGTFPVRRGTADRKAIKHAIDLLNSEKVVCMFPEGTRSLDGKLGEAESGVGLIALKTKAPIVPVAVIGTEKILPGDSSRPVRHEVKVVYGKPLTFPEFDETRDTRTAVEEIGRRVMSAIEDLLSKHANLSKD